MTGKEFKEYLENRGIPVVSLARKMGVAPQIVSNKFQRLTIKPEYLAKVNTAIEELQASWGVSPNAGKTEEKEIDIIEAVNRINLLQREVEILRQQNDFLQKMLDRLTERQ